MSKLYDKAADAVKKRNYDYAIDLLIQELTLEPNNVEARKALRAAELKKFQEAGKAFSSNRVYINGLGTVVGSWIHKLTKNHERVMLDCEQLLKHAPRHKGILGTLGDASVKAGHLDAAICAFEELREADRESQRALRGLARLYKEKGDLPKSLVYYEALKKLNAADPEAAKAVRDLAASVSTNKVEAAKVGGDGSFRDVVKDKGKTDDLEMAGKLLRTESDIDAAIKREEKALKDAGKDDPKILKRLGDLCVKKKDYEEAMELYERALAVKKDPLIADALGDLKIRQFRDEVTLFKEAVEKGEPNAKPKYKEAKDRQNLFLIEEYKRRAEDRPTELIYKFQLGQVLYESGRYDEAIGELQKAVQDPKRGQMSRMLLGKAFKHKGMHDQAIKQFEKAREGMSSMDDINKEITYNVGIVQEAAGQKDKAKAEYEKIIEVDIGYKDVMKRLEALK